MKKHKVLTEDNYKQFLGKAVFLVDVGPSMTSVRLVHPSGRVQLLADGGDYSWRLSLFTARTQAEALLSLASSSRDEILEVIE